MLVKWNKDKDIFSEINAGDNFTNNFSFETQISIKKYFNETPFPHISSLQIFAHIMIVQLSCHMQILYHLFCHNMQKSKMKFPTNLKNSGKIFF